MTYYHGGPSGLAVILPPSKTGAHSVSEYGAAGVHSPEHCYVTTNYEAAAMFAAMAPSEQCSVYEVLPDGILLPDPDCSEPGLSWQCSWASVIRERRLPPVTVQQIRKAMGRRLPIVGRGGPH